MLREIITSANQNLTLHLPEDMVGKTVEVIAFEISDAKVEYQKDSRLKQIKDLTKDTLVDLSNFKFDRDEANNYDE